MKRKERLPELLAPAGSREALYAAVSAGADAVYLGGRFNARAYAKNFDDAALFDAVAYAHAFGVRVYVTLNTLLYDREMQDFLSYAGVVRECGADAAIVADAGAMRLLHEELPGLELHASTQAFVHSTAGADVYAALGCRRVVLAREMTGEGIAAVTAACRAETEVFLHGALCVCHSGQCLFSSLVGGRSGNRGECAQPCRLPYNGAYPLSLRDLCLAGHIPELIGSGVASLKIEGRMKSPGYVFRVCSVYRRLLDEGRCATPAEFSELEAAFSRGGFTDRYFTGRHRLPMCGVRSEADKEKTRLSEEERAYLPKKKSLRAEAILLPAEAARLTLDDGAHRVSVTGEKVDLARTAPISSEFVTTQLCKMGATFYTLAPEDVAVTLGEGCFATAGGLNALRRAATEALREATRAPLSASRQISAALPPEDGDSCPSAVSSERAVPVSGGARLPAQAADGIFRIVKGASENPARPSAVGTEKEFGTEKEAGFSSRDPAVSGTARAAGGQAPVPSYRSPRLTRTELPRRQAVCYTAEQLRVARDSGWFDLCVRPLFLRGADPADGVMLPPVVMPGEEDEFCRALRQSASEGVRYALCEAPWQFAPARQAGLIPLGDFRLNVTNAKTFSLFSEMGVGDLVLSPEIPMRALSRLPGRVLTYGRIPLMVTERCFMREIANCDACGRTALCDRRQARFPILRIPIHRNEILNSLPTYMGDRPGELAEAGITAEQYRFTVESAEETQDVIAAARAARSLPLPVRRLVR